MPSQNDRISHTALPVATVMDSSAVLTGLLGGRSKNFTKAALQAWVKDGMTSADLTDATVAGRAMLAAVNAAAQRTLLGLDTLQLTRSAVVADTTARLAMSAAASLNTAVVESDTGDTWMLLQDGDPAEANDWLQIGDRDVTWGEVTGKPEFGGASLLEVGTGADEVAAGDHSHALLDSATDSATFVGLRNILTVLSAANRKNAATYTGADSASVGYTRVFQSDLPGILWTLIAADVTLDASWIGQPYTVDPDGDVIVSMELADITGTIPDRNVLGVRGNQLRLGDGVTPDGVDVFPSAAKVMSLAGDRLIDSLAVIRGASNAGTCYFATTRSVSGRLEVKTSTGYARLVNPDNTLGAQVGTGAAGNYITLTIPASGLHRAYGIISVTNGGTVRSGDITYLDIRSYDQAQLQLTSFSGTGLSALTYLDLSTNQLTEFSSAGLSALTYLNLDTNQLTTFSGTGLSALTYLNLDTNQLTTFSGTGLSALTTLYLNSNQLTSFSGTGLSALTSLVLNDNQLTEFSSAGLSALTYLNLDTNQLTTFSGTGLSALTSLDLNDNQLTEFSGTGLAVLIRLQIRNNNLTSILVPLNLSSGTSQPSDIGDNDLSLEALQAFVDLLLVTTTGRIKYGVNLGSTAFAAWLTAENDKDYIWSNT